MKSLGILEVCGYSTALLAVNQMYQHCNIKVITIDFDKPAVVDLDKMPLVAQVKFVGYVEDVKHALEVGKREALKHNGEEEVIARCIPNYHDGMVDLIRVSKLKKK
ncbi:MAG: BMC domain-containing protein [Eubacteriales bacterium]